MIPLEMLAALGDAGPCWDGAHTLRATGDVAGFWIVTAGARPWLAKLPPNALRLIDGNVTSVPVRVGSRDFVPPPGTSFATEASMPREVTGRVIFHADVVDGLLRR